MDNKIATNRDIEGATSALRRFLNSPAIGTVRDVMAEGSAAQTALNLLDGRLTVDAIKITLSEKPEPTKVGE